MSRRAGIPLGCVVVMLPFALIWGGSQGFHEATAFPKPRVLTYAQFEKERPKEGWFTITSAGVTPLEASWMVTRPDTTVTETDGGKVAEKAPSRDEMAKLNELFLPVHNQADGLTEDDHPVFLMLQTHNEHSIHSVQQMAKVTRDKGESGFRHWLNGNLDRVWERRNLTGMLQVGINASADTRKELSKVSNLAPDFVILKEGERPQMGFAVAMLTAGILMLLVPILLIVAACLRSPGGGGGPKIDEFALPGAR